MGIIMKNGIAYGASSDEAFNISYDNTKSGLSASNVQNAIDEVSEKLFESGDIDLSEYETKTDSQTKYNDAVAHSDVNLGTAKSYTDEKIANLLNNSTEAVDSIYELRDAMENNADAIEALTTVAASKVPTSRKINNKELTSDITLTASDVGADPSGSASAVQTNLNTHESDTVKHITSDERTNWNVAKTHADSAHAPSDAEKNKIVGVQVNGSDLTINSSTRKVNVTVPTKASDVGADPAGSASSALENAKTYTDSAVSNKANVSHKHVVTDITGLTASVDELNYMDGVTSNVQTQLDTKADKSNIATTVFKGTATENNTYWKISDFGNWGTGAWYQKGFSMLISSRAGELIWVSIAANDSNTSAEAIRLMNRYSKIGALYYSASESAIYVLAAGWANNICAHILTNVNGDYVPTITNASGLPSDAAAIGITELGASSSETNVGSSQKTLELRGSEDRPSYNFTDLALFSDIPTDYAKAEDVNNSISGLQGSLDQHSTNEANARSTAIATAKQEAIDIAAADATTKANKALKDANTYTDDKVALLMNNSSDAIDSIMELAEAMKTNEDVVDALEDAVGTKASKSDLSSHANNKSNPHGVTAAQVGALPTSGGTLTGGLTVSDKVIQGSPSDHSSIASMNRLQTDLFVQGNGTAPNNPDVPGFYLGKSATDENRHMDIVSGSDYSYIDFNKAGRGSDYDARLLVNVNTGITAFMWGNDSALTEKIFNIQGTIQQHGVQVATTNDLAPLSARLATLENSIVTVHSGDSYTPVDELGEDGDIYIVTV